MIPYRLAAYAIAIAMAVGGWVMYARTARTLAIERAISEHDRQRAEQDAADIEVKWAKQLQEAQHAAETRTKTISAAATAARSERDRLRDEVARLNSLPADTAAAERESARRARAALDACSERYQGVAGELDGRESDIRALIEAWPR